MTAPSLKTMTNEVVYENLKGSYNEPTPFVLSVNTHPCHYPGSSDIDFWLAERINALAHYGQTSDALLR